MYIRSKTVSHIGRELNLEMYVFLYVGFVDELFFFLWLMISFVNKVKRGRACWVFLYSFLVGREFKGSMVYESTM